MKKWNARFRFHTAVLNILTFVFSSIDVVFHTRDGFGKAIRITKYRSATVFRGGKLYFNVFMFVLDETLLTLNLLYCVDFSMVFNIIILETFVIVISKIEIPLQLSCWRHLPVIGILSIYRSVRYIFTSQI